MQIPFLSAAGIDRDPTVPGKHAKVELTGGEERPADELKQAFQDFVGQTLFSQMIKAARSSQQPSAYFDGGRAEEIFRGQLDQVLAEKMSDASGDKIAEPMYELFMLRRQR